VSSQDWREESFSDIGVWSDRQETPMGSLPVVNLAEHDSYKVELSGCLKRLYADALPPALLLDF
jgi:hypothetical protein